MAERPERRRVRRVQTTAPVRLETSDGTVFTAEAEDVSLVGLWARVQGTLAVGQRCRVELGSGAERIEAQGTIVRHEPDRVALRFDLLPYESCERLRTLLLARADDPAALAAELDDRLGFLGEDAA